MDSPSPNGSNARIASNASILKIIFEHAAYTPINESPEDNIRPRRPYLGQVCKAWDAIIINTPLYWVSIVVYIDSNPTHTEDRLAESPLKTYLFRSSPHPVTIYLLRKVKVPHTLDLKEKSAIHSILTALAPHSHRISGLYIEANTSSSLPSVSDLLSADSGFFFKNLKCLMATSNCDDSHILPLPLPLPLSLPPLSVISLTYLNMDGRNLFLSLNPPCHLLQHLSQLESLCINHLTPRVDGFSMALVDKLFDAITNTLVKLRTLGFDEFEVPPNATSLPPPDSLLPCSVRRLVIRKTASPSMQYIFQRVTHSDELGLIGCFFSEPKVLLPKSARLVLERTVDFDLLPDIILEWTAQRWSSIRAKLWTLIFSPSCSMQ
ncbi:hypothetical protein EST38_g9199 [Candolleomyces aberdarensis]|uniref:F-box domain-containing protein n=1 Tax=Candolleomyces aberdarensis TaxID=2316362 RepID=A0A4Q2DDS1_9AGAR|nr:hypothetical protein EST38_g9199 [Candolleomyces aberdarensis]